MARFMFLLYENPASFADLSPEEMQQIIEKYGAWAEGLRAAGKLAGSEKLKDGEGRVARAAGGKMRVLDGPYSETKEVIGGYFTIVAGDYDEALAIAEGCPHLAHGGTIEIREIEEIH